MNYMQTIKKLMTSIFNNLPSNGLKHTWLNDKKMRQVPKYLVIGTSGSGKTTLLANSKINFISKKTEPTTDPGIWVMSDAVLIDVPGNYIQTQKNAADTPAALWPQFLEQVKKHSRKSGLAGTIIAVSLSEIMDAQQQSALLETLEHNLQQLRTNFGNELPIYFAITKCDLLPGFAEFFSDYGSNELEQAWGIPIPADKQDKALYDIFITRFNVLINRLNKQLIPHLHQERNPHAKFFIKDFPLQLEKLKTEFAKIVKSLAAKWEDLNLKGVYLTSSTQAWDTESAAKNMQTISNNELQNALIILQTPITPVQTYFVKQFLLQRLTPTQIKTRPAHRQPRKLVYALIVCFALLSTYFFSKDLSHKMKETSQRLVFQITKDGSLNISNE